MVYYSRWNGYEERTLLGCGVYPIKQIAKGSAVGPAPKLERYLTSESGVQEEQEDVIDEAIMYFKSNMLFRTFKAKGAGDRLLLILTMYIHQCVKALVGVKQSEAKGVLAQFANEPIVAPGDKSFPFASFYPAAANAEEVELFRAYMTQLRTEVGQRVAARVFEFPEADGTGSKFWLVFAKSTLLSGLKKDK